MTTEFWVGPHNEPDSIRLGPAVASGAEGVVYRAFVDLASGPVEVAVKMLQPGHLANLGKWTARWRDQVELLKQVEVPGLVAVRGDFIGPLPHSRGQGDTTTASLYLVMDWVEGVSLDRWARSVEVAEPEQLLMALVPVAAALDLLHSGAATGGYPVVHRDVKPANILIRPGGDTVLVDVGSVRGLIDEPGRSGMVGTPGYIAPEVRTDARYSPAGDRYALGAVAFALLTGTEPPSEGTTEDLSRRLAAAPLLRGRPELVDHVLAMLDPLPERRPSCLANWVAQLRRSSLAALPGEVVLAPRAPGRNPQRLPNDGESPSRQARSSRRHRLVVVGAGLGLVAITTVLLGGDQDADPSRGLAAVGSVGLGQARQGGSVGTDAPVVVGQWRAIDPGPLATRGEPKAAWTGTEVLVVGGLLIDQYQPLSDGAAFDPSTESWRPIPPRPVGGRVMHAVWTGEELVTLGTEGISLETLTTGAAFNPATDQWRTVTLPPSSEVPQDVYWTGRRLLAWQPGASSPGALYDPTADLWTPIPVNSVPGALAGGRATWTGEELAVEGALAPANGGPVEQRLFLFDPDLESWRVGPALPGEIAGWPFLSPLWSGQEVIVSSTRAGSDAPATYAYDPDLDRWRTIDDPDLSIAPGYFSGVALDDGRRVVRVGNVEHPLQVFDPKTGRWSSSAPAPGALPTPDGALVSTGTSVFHWGIATDGNTVQARSPNAAWLWSP